ncbi:glutamine synthetase, partial [Rhizobiaceae sp. 2RAB30]
LYLERAASEGRRGVSRLPRTLLEAVEFFEQSEFAKRIWGAEFVSLYSQQKKKEWETAFYHVGADERERQLAFV